MMATSYGRYKFNSNVFVIVIIVCICVCEIRNTSQQSSTNNDGVKVEPKIIDVPQRKNPTNCPSGERKDKNGNCRLIW
jgi:hypothetical protein